MRGVTGCGCATFVSTVCCLAMYICAARLGRRRRAHKPWYLHRDSQAGCAAATADVPAASASTKVAAQARSAATAAAQEGAAGARCSAPVHSRAKTPRRCERPADLRGLLPEAKREAKRRATHPWRRRQQRRCWLRAGRRVARRRGVRLSRWNVASACDMANLERSRRAAHAPRNGAATRSACRRPSAHARAGPARRAAGVRRCAGAVPRKPGKHAPPTRAARTPRTGMAALCGSCVCVLRCASGAASRAAAARGDRCCIWLSCQARGLGPVRQRATAPQSSARVGTRVARQA